MDLALSSRIKAIFTKVFCTFFTSLLPPISGAICRPTGALLRSTRFRERIHTKRPLIPTFLSNDNEVERRFAERARNQITPPRPGFSIQVRYFNLQLNKWKRNAMENRHDMPLSSLLLFLFPSILISISRIPSNRRSFTLPLFTHFILRISQRFRSIDITQLLSFSHLSLFIPISPLFESLFSKSIPIVVPIFLPFFSLYLEFLFSKDSYLIISPLFSLSLSISTSVLSFLSFKDSVQRYRFFRLSIFSSLSSFFFLVPRFLSFRSSFKDSLFLSFFVQSSIQNHVLPLSLLFSFHIYLFQLCPFLHDRSTLKIHVCPYEFLPLPFRG